MIDSETNRSMRRAAALVALLSRALTVHVAVAQPAPPPAPITPPAAVPPVRTQAMPPPARNAATPSAPEALDAKLAALFAPDGLTADRVAERATATSPDVRARRAEIDSAAASVDQALYAFFPRLAGLARYRRLSPIEPPNLGNLVAAPSVGSGPVPAGTPLVNVPLTFPVFLNEYVLEATLDVPLSDYVLRTSQAYAAASHSRRAAVLGERAARLKTGTDAKALYYSWVRAKLQQVVAEQALEQARAHAADVRALASAGSASKADVLRVDSQLASSELLVERAHHLTDVLHEQLRIVMHQPASITDAIGEDVRAALAPVPGEEDLERLYGDAIRQRPEIRALDETSWSLRDQAKAARAAYAPRLDALGEVMYANPNPRIFPPTDEFRGTWAVGVQLSWSPNDALGGSASARGFDARAASTSAQKDGLADALRGEVAQARQALLDAEAAVRTTANGLAAAEESYRVRRELFLRGAATSVELTDAETDLTRARLEAINASVDVRIARVRLLHATGRDAPTEP